MQEVAALCDVVVVMSAGRVVACGTTDELRARTGEGSLEDAFVALTSHVREPDLGEVTA